MDLTSLLQDTLAAHGYRTEQAPPLEGRSGATYPANLLAHQHEHRLLIDVTTNPLSEADIQALDAIVQDTGVDAALLLALADAEDPPPATPHVTIWTRTHLEQAIGAHLLHGTLQTEADPNHIGPTPIDPDRLPQDPPKATQEDTQDPTSPEPTLHHVQPASDATTEPTPEPQVKPQPEPAQAQPEQQPQPDQEPQQSTQPPQPEPATAQDTTPDQGGYMDPEEMAKRAQELLEQDAIPDDGDAEIIMDNEPAPQPEPTPQPNTEAQPKSTPEPSTDPNTTSQPTPDPEPATAQDTTPDQGGYMDPEEMAKRAQELLEQDAIPDDGDAEIITAEDPHPTPQPEPNEETTPSPAAEPQPEPQPTPEPPQEGQVFEDADCEILPSKPRATQPEPETEPTNKTTQDDAPPSTASNPTETGQTSSLAALTSDATPENTDEEPFLSGGCIAPTITEDQARKAAQGALFNVQEARLELLPFHVFDYACQLEGDGTTRTEEGRVWISAQNGAIVNEPQNVDLIDDPGIPHERYQADLTPHQAQSQALQHLQDSLERREELREDYSETAIIERVTLKPIPESLELDHQGTAYAPRWRLDGQNGNVYVDALTGDIVPA